MFVVGRGEEAACLATAFHRYIELHGRVACDPRCRCAIEAAFGSPLDPNEILVVRLWNERAAREFDLFWISYRRVYGGLADYACSPAT
jgi:hypothetical protein